MLASGVFDIIHPGHIFYLESARALGDELVVIVASDATARRRKGETVMSLESRLRVVSSLRVVDRAIPGSEGDIYPAAVELAPDVIALGHDQRFDVVRLQRELGERGLSPKIVRLTALEGDLHATRRIVEWIKNGSRRKEEAA